jgi:flagellar biosynthetic protein FliQ
MNSAGVLVAARDMLVIALTLVSPFLLAAIVASLLVGLLQATTRMNDLTLSFVPRFLAVLLAIYLAANWTTARMAHYVERAAIGAVALTR